MAQRRRTRRVLLGTLPLAIVVVVALQVSGTSNVVARVVGPIAEASSVVFGPAASASGSVGGSAVGAPLQPPVPGGPGSGSVPVGGQGAPLASGSTGQAVISPLKIPNFLGLDATVPADLQSLSEWKSSQTARCVEANDGRLAECELATEAMFAAISFSSSAPLPENSDPSGCYYVSTPGPGGRPTVHVVGSGCRNAAAPGAFDQKSLPKDPEPAPESTAPSGEQEKAPQSDKKPAQDLTPPSDDSSTPTSSSPPSSAGDDAKDPAAPARDDSSAPAK